MNAPRSHNPHSLSEVVDRFRGARAWVIGDCMLDEYLSGSVDRICPEAPVPIVRVARIEQRPGGAANVALQLATLGVRTSLAGTVGADPAGEALLALCAAANVDTSAVVREVGRPTTRKVRITGQGQQLLRLDWETTTPSSPEIADEMLAALRRAERPDVVVLSDYAKGVLTPRTLQALLCREKDDRTPVVIDPKHRDFSRYTGATFVTPNLRELEEAVGRMLDPNATDAIAMEARRLTHEMGLDGMVVTLGSRGMLVVSAAGSEALVPAITRPVYDVTGAGDTAVAVLAAGLAVGESLLASARIANIAASIAVGRVGTAAVEFDVLRDAISDVLSAKQLSIAELTSRAAVWRASGRRIVFTNGCFDILHAGHLALLEGASRLGHFLVVAINSDNSVRRMKGDNRPLTTERERAALLAALTCVDAVTVFDSDTPYELIRAVMPDVLVKGSDYTLDEVVGGELVRAAGGRVELLQLVPERSTSALVERIRGVP